VPGVPGRRFSLGLPAPVEQLKSEGELPQAYGTRALFLTARDPHWLYAHWDFTREQQRALNRRSADRHLVLRLHDEAASRRPLEEIHVHPESRQWFVHVEDAGLKYRVDLGYYQPDQKWVSVAASPTTATPPDRWSSNTAACFATIPYSVPLSQLPRLEESTVRANPPSVAQVAGAAAAPAFASEAWGLAEIAGWHSERSGGLSSQELGEWPPLPSDEFTAPTSLSSPFGGATGAKGFWLNVNAELIIYGATEPDAVVTLGGKTIPLRQDGTFSFRYSLPDGNYELPVVARSADQTEARAAELNFSRRTELRGAVGVHPQDPELAAPAANVAE